MYRRILKGEIMMKSKIDLVVLVKQLLGEDVYFKFLTQIAKQENGNIKLDEFYEEVLEKYCCIILNISISKVIQVESYKIRTSRGIISIDTNKFCKKYEDYIKIIQSKREEYLKEII